MRDYCVWDPEDKMALARFDERWKQTLEREWHLSGTLIVLLC